MCIIFLYNFNLLYEKLYAHQDILDKEESCIQLKYKSLYKIRLNDIHKLFKIKPKKVNLYDYY